MSLRPSDSDDLKRSLELARQGVRQLEMGACRLRNDLTRLEVALEDRRGDNLADKVEPRPSGDDAGAMGDDCGPTPAFADSAASLAVELDPYSPIAEPTFTDDAVVSFVADATEPASSADVVEHWLADSDNSLSGVSLFAQRARRTYRYITSPAVVSALIHSAIILLIASISVATIVHNSEPFAATFVDVELGEKPPEELDTSFDLGKPGENVEASVENALVDGAQLDLAGPVVDDVVPVEFETPESAGSVGDAGVLTALATDLGTELPGNGGTGPDGAAPAAGNGEGKGKPSARRGGAGGQAGALFFGAKAKGDRFVFVIDNSSSMKNGRLELALTELVRTVESLSAKQSFYVIFVSDQTYPMFYPLLEPELVPATPANKKRLIEWLPKVVLASGKNRELIKAMDTAAALRPHAVYLLWDGDMKYSENVRLDVMTHLTAPGWNFTVHTIGMGLTTAESMQNLTAIAEAHGGMFRRVDLPTMRVR